VKVAQDLAAGGKDHRAMQIQQDGEGSLLPLAADRQRFLISSLPVTANESGITVSKTASQEMRPCPQEQM
jgi:hypothetical protein